MKWPLRHRCTQDPTHYNQGYPHVVEHYRPRICAVQFGNIVVGSAVWEPGLELEPQSISCVALAVVGKALRAVRVDSQGRSTHCDSPPSPAGSHPL
jgi:hypothetical protein